MLRLRCARVLGWLLCTVALLAASTWAGPGTAFAHAHYDHSQPGIGEVVASSPARVDIYTDQDLAKIAGGNIISVTDKSSSNVDDGNTVVDDADRKHFSVGLKSSLPPGRYLVRFTTLSDVDGDTDHGQFAFYVGRQPTSQEKALDARLGTTGAAAASGGSHTAVWIVVGVVAAVVLLGGAAGFVLWRRRPAR